MLNHTSDAHEGRESAQKRALHRAVLVDLRDNGGMRWPALYLHFDGNGSGEIGSALGLLARWNHISVEIDGKTKITEAGTERLLHGN